MGKGWNVSRHVEFRKLFEWSHWICGAHTPIDVQRGLGSRDRRGGDHSHVDRVTPARVEHRLEYVPHKSSGSIQITCGTPRAEIRSILCPCRQQEFEVALIKKMPANERAQNDQRQLLKSGKRIRC